MTFEVRSFSLVVDNFELELRKLTGVIEDPFPKGIEEDWGTDLSLTNRLMTRGGGQLA